MDRISIADYVSNAIYEFGKEVNLNRQLPSLYDGLKPVYRRLIYTAMSYSSSVPVKSATIIGTCMGKYHPHGDRSLMEPLNQLYHHGIFEGNGNFGKKSLMGEDIRAAAPRYTEVMMSQKYRDIFSDLLDYVPYVEAEIAGNNEPVYLPTPIPLCLLQSTFGIGIGVNSRIPAFTFDSIMDAYLNNDPYLLESAYGLELVKDESELHRLWNTGLGRLSFKMKVYQGSTAGADGTFIEGNPAIFRPLLSDINKWVTQNKAFKLNLMGKHGNKLFIGRNYNIKSLPLNELYEACVKAGSYKRNYRLTVADNDRVYLIPLKNWIDVTMNNYISLITKYKEDHIKRYKFEYEVYKYLPQVAKLIMEDDLTTSEIANKLEISENIVDSVFSKSISNLKKKDTSSKLESINSKIEYYSSLKESEYLNKISKKFQNLK